MSVIECESTGGNAAILCIFFRSYSRHFLGEAWPPAKTSQWAFVNLGQEPEALQGQIQCLTSSTRCPQHLHSTQKMHVCWIKEWINTIERKQQKRSLCNVGLYTKGGTIIDECKLRQYNGPAFLCSLRRKGVCTACLASTVAFSPHHNDTPRTGLIPTLEMRTLRAGKSYCSP